MFSAKPLACSSPSLRRVFRALLRKHHTTDPEVVLRARNIAYRVIRYDEFKHTNEMVCAIDCYVAKGTLKTIYLLGDEVLVVIFTTEKSSCVCQ